MKNTTHRFVSLLALGAGLFGVNAALAKDAASNDKVPIASRTSKGELVRPTEKDAAWLAKAKVEYPSAACVVSNEKLEGADMGLPQDFIYRETGKPDRLIRFCCKDCVKDFKKDPDKYLNALNDAAAKKAKGSS